jgi:hypothetical protein
MDENPHLCTRRKGRAPATTRGGGRLAESPLRKRGRKARLLPPRRTFSNRRGGFRMAEGMLGRPLHPGNDGRN